MGNGQAYEEFLGILLSLGDFVEVDELWVERDFDCLPCTLSSRVSPNSYLATPCSGGRC